MDGASEHFEQPSRAHAAADAHGDDDVPDFPAPSLDQRVPDEPCATHAVWVANRDRATVDIEPVRRNAETIAAVEGLDGEGLVELPQPDVIDVEAGSLEQPRDREDGADAHLVGLASDHHQVAEDAERLDPAGCRAGRRP